MTLRSARLFPLGALTFCLLRGFWQLTLSMPSIKCASLSVRHCSGVCRSGISHRVDGKVASVWEFFSTNLHTCRKSKRMSVAPRASNFSKTHSETVTLTCTWMINHLLGQTWYIQELFVSKGASFVNVILVRNLYKAPRRFVGKHVTTEGKTARIFDGAAWTGIVFVSIPSRW